MACRGAGARVQAAAPLPPRGVAAAVHRTATGLGGPRRAPCAPVQLAATQLGYQQLPLQRMRGGLVVTGSQSPSAPGGGGSLDGPAWRAYVLELQVLGTATEEACQAMLQEHRKYKASTQREAQELQARMEAHDRLLCGPEQQQAADAPSAAQPSAPAPLPPTAVNTSPAGTVLPAGMVLPEVAEEFAKTAVACAKVAVAAEAAAEAARAAARDRPARSVWRATSLENAVDQWKQAALSWGSALDALQVARQLGPEVPAVAEAGAAVVAAFRLQRQRIEKEERKKRKSGLDG